MTEHTHEDDDDRGVVRRFLDWVWDTIKTWGPALLVVLLIRSVIAEPFRIPSGSMVPTLAIGDHILVTKYSYGFRIPLTRIPIGELKVPERGDVVVFVYPPSDQGHGLSHWLDMPFPPIATYDYVKRVVGLPGDVIQVRDNTVYINGDPQTREYMEPYVFTDDSCRSHATKRFTENLGGHEHSMLTATGARYRSGDWGPETIPPGMVFCMGDNRDHSADSRVWGYVPLRNIKGKAQFVWLSYNQCEGDLPVFGSFRTERFGTPVE